MGKIKRRPLMAGILRQHPTKSFSRAFVITFNKQGSAETVHRTRMAGRLDEHARENQLSIGRIGTMDEDTAEF